MMSRSFLMATVLLGATACWGANITFNITEDKPSYSPPANGSWNSGQLVLCESYDPNTTSCTGSRISDLLQWSGGNMLLFRSDLEPGQDPLPGSAEMGIPNFDPSFGSGTIYILENQYPSAYNPTSKQPGGSLVPADNYQYRVYSDASTPEPAALLLCGMGALVIGFTRFASAKRT
jgi:hypothetical protein